MGTEENTKQQFVLGNDVRAAGRDYFESLSIEKAEEWLALQSDEVRDRYAAEGGGAFQLIYRFSLPPEKRVAVIDLTVHRSSRRGRIGGARIAASSPAGPRHGDGSTLCRTDLLRDRWALLLHLRPP